MMPTRIGSQEYWPVLAPGLGFFRRLGDGFENRVFDLRLTENVAESFTVIVVFPDHCVDELLDIRPLEIESKCRRDKKQEEADACEESVGH